MFYVETETIRGGYSYRQSTYEYDDLNEAVAEYNRLAAEYRRREYSDFEWHDRKELERDNIDYDYYVSLSHQNLDMDEACGLESCSISLAKKRDEMLRGNGS